MVAHLTINKTITISNELIAIDLDRLINQIWKLLPMREKKENWEQQLELGLEEIYGLLVMFGEQLDLIILLSQLEGLPHAKTFYAYRAGIFSAISTLTEIANNVRKS